MPLRPCLDCGRPADRRRCTSCTKPTPYDLAHRHLRADWAPDVAAGTVVCRRAPFGLCVADDPVIGAGEDWHLGHPDDQCPAPTAPEHVLCNSGAPRRQTT